MITYDHFRKPISSLNLHEVFTLSPDTSLEETIKVMKEKNFGSVVIKDDEVLGIFTERDLISKCELIFNSDDIKISEVMTPNPYMLSDDKTIIDAAVLMSGKEFRHTPIASVDGSIKMLSIKDILSVLVSLTQDKLEDVPPISDWSKLSYNLAEKDILVQETFADECLSHQFFHVPLRRIYSTRISYVSDTLSIRDTIKKFKDQRTAVGLVMHYETEIKGIVTERDFLMRAFGTGMDLDRPVKDIMTADPHLLSKEHFFYNALKNMFHFNYRNVPIVNTEGFPIGNISLLELLIFFNNALGFRKIRE
jgi:signal-transduction protein with cAMP-binding, CBS, and nucleotidyltransferase domain